MVNSKKYKIQRRKKVGGNNSITIAVLSQNNVVQESLQQLQIDDINNHKPDIYLEMTQEDMTNLFEKRSINKIEGYTLLHMESMLKLTTAFNDFNIRTKVFVRNGFNRKIDILSKGSISLKSTPSGWKSYFPFTKGCVYVKLQVEGCPPIMLVNAHLPMLKIKDEHGDVTDDLGFEFRKQSLKTLLTDLIAKGLDHETTLFLGGDLNFRITLDGKDQLTELLNTDELQPKLKELDFINDEDKIFTCKFQTGIPRDKQSCRNTKVPASIDSTEIATDQSVIKTIQDTVQHVCGDEERFPSRCDRFLTSVPSSANIEVVVHKGNYFPEMISDHNSLITVFKYSPYSKIAKKHILRFESGDVYEGEMADGTMNGHGIWRYADGRQHEGDWIDGQLHGLVVSRTKEGEIIRNEFDHGQYVRTISNKRGGKKSRRCLRRLTRKQK
jgi:hypothetical protein